MNDVRKAGLRTLLIWGVVTAIFVVAGQALAERGWHFLGYGFAIPGAVMLVGFVQLVSGVPFADLSDRWDQLAGWQRGVLGTLIFLAACGVIFLGIFIFVTLAYG